MKNVLFIAPTRREYRSLPAIAERLGIRLIWDDFAGDYFDDFQEKDATQKNTLDIVDLIERTIKAHQDDNLSGVTSAVGYPGMSAVAVIAERFSLPGPRTGVIMQCEHKYYSRLAQRELVPEATPKLWLIDPQNNNTIESVQQYPVFLKPVKSCMSMNAFRVHSKDELSSRVSQATMPERFNKPFDDMAKAYTTLSLSCDYLLVEEMLYGKQVSLEGYVYNGKPVVMGTVDGEMVGNTLSFHRWIYPSRLPSRVLERMEEIAVKFFSGVGYDNAMFNMELMWNPETDQVSIIEVNPKIASQFPDLFEKVDGTNGYDVLLKLAIGDEPQLKRRKGTFAVAASCVLRMFEDRKVVRKPGPEHIEAVKKKFPDALITVIATEGKNLSEQTQDTSSFRYGLINIGAQSVEALEEKNEICKSMLPFEFAEPSPETVEDDARRRR